MFSHKNTIAGVSCIMNTVELMIYTPIHDPGKKNTVIFGTCPAPIIIIIIIIVLSL